MTVQTYLHLNIQHTNPPFLRNIVHRLDTRPIEITSKLCMLNESLLVHQVAKLLLGDKVILDAILFGPSRGARRMRDAEAEFVGELVEQALQDGRLARAAGAGDDDGAVRLDGLGVDGCGVEGCHFGRGEGEGAEGRKVVVVWEFEGCWGGG